ncbi:MAG TPA: hypothetical protein VLA97_01730 [Nocardioidaceae bacterium]|nr:hypothetical protein [Nocardioidaceae bacterium]
MLVVVHPDDRRVAGFVLGSGPGHVATLHAIHVLPELHGRAGEARTTSAARWCPSGGIDSQSDARVVFRTPGEGTPVHIDLDLDGYRVGLASEASSRDDSGLDPVVAGQRAAVILWTGDMPAAYGRLQELGATPVKAPQPWLDRLLIARAEDPDGHLIQVVQPAARTPN